MSAFLAAAMFASGGAFGDLARIGFTATAEETSDQDSELDSSADTDMTENEDADDNDDNDEELTDYGDLQVYYAAGDNKIRIKPAYNIAFDNWLTNTYSADNPYVLKSESSFTLCGTMAVDEVHKTGVDCGDNCNWTKTTNGYCISKDGNTENVGNFWVDDTHRDKLPQQGYITREAVLNNGNPTGEVRVYVTYKAGKVNPDNMFNGIITFDNGVPWNKDDPNCTKTWEQFHISVRPSFIKVFTEVAERDMDKVNEFVDSIYLSPKQAIQVHDNYIWNSMYTPYRIFPNELFYIRGIGSNGNGGFKTEIYKVDKNNKVLTDVVNLSSSDTTKNWYVYKTYTAPDTPYTTYCIQYDTGYNGETEKFYFYVEPNQTLDHADIEISDHNTYTVENKVLENVNGEEVERTYRIEYEVFVSDITKSEIYDKSGQRLTLRNQYWDFMIANQSNDADLRNFYTQNNNDDFKNTYNNIINQDWYKNAGDGSKLNGDEKYWYNQCKKFETAEKYVKICRAYELSKKNKSDLSGNDLTDYENLVERAKMVPREMDHIPAEDYWKDPTKNPGDPQFELTSKYELNGDSRLIYESIGDNLKFSMTDVATVDFHVELYLEPKSVKVYNDDTNEYVDSNNAKYNLADFSSVTVKGVVFEMNHQSVLDAYNKCPDHTGLDFTFSGNISEYINIEPTYVAFEATKNFEHNPDPDKVQPFKFNLYYVNDSNEEILLETVENNDDGNVRFIERCFNEGGTYKYRIREVIDENDNTIVYDRGYIEVVVKVDKKQELKETFIGYTQIMREIQNVTFVQSVTYQKINSNGTPESDVSDQIKQFINTYKVYDLPSTGGPGVYIFIISGAGFILAAAVMLYRKKAKGGVSL